MITDQEMGSQPIIYSCGQSRPRGVGVVVQLFFN